MGYRLGVLLGDGIGAEVVPEAVRVAKAAVKAAGVDVEWIDMPIGCAAYDAFGTTLPDGTIEKLAGLDGWVLGPQAVPRAHSGVDEKRINPSAVLRKH
ncbi:MAG: isocitrate/isopropylmalate family dehydrogenase, partial [Alphaproteobacteria bacterium]